MKIIAKDQAEFVKAELWVNSLRLDKKQIDTIEFNLLSGLFDIKTFKSFENELHIIIPKSWGFWKVYTTERTEDTVTMTHISLCCKGMRFIYINSTNKFTIEIFDDSGEHKNKGR